MGLLSGLIGAATNAVGANENAQANAAKSNMAAALQRAQLQRQDQQDLLQQAIQAREAHSQELRDQLTGAQIGDTNQQMKLRERQASQPVAPVLGTPQYLQAEAALADAKAKAEARYRRDPQDHFQSVGATDPTTHETHLYRFNTTTGQYEDSGLGPKPGGTGGSATGAQVPVADMEARFAEIAKAGDDLASGKLKITPIMQTREGVNYANDLGTAGGHPSLPTLLTAGAFNALGVGGKGYQSYEQLMTSTRALGDDVASVFKGRQGEAKTLREIALSRLTPEDAGNPENVRRKLDRLQHVIALAKLNNPGQQGLEGPQGIPGVSNPAATSGVGQPALSPEDQAHAQRDPEFAAWLHSHGYKP